MRVAYLDCFSGISGDMLLGALLDAGVDAALFHSAVDALGLNARIEFERVNRSGISAMRAHVIIGASEEDHAHAVLAGAHQQHSAGHHRHPDHQHDRSNPTPHGRSLAEITDLISRAPLDAAPLQLALRAFRLLAEAEAKIHDMAIDKIHFHEVGATDAIVDVVCAAVGCTALGIQRWLCSPLNVGSGTVECAHGIFPVPAPAVTELLKGARVYSSGIRAEMVTPTGAAILRALDAEFTDLPAITVESAGYGAGSRDLPGIANVVRITVGESTADMACETVTVIETAVDDLTPQVIGHVMDRAFAEGALDVMVTPVHMKKNRPGHLLTILCHPQDQARQRDLLLRETTTLGVRMRQDRRQCLRRTFETVRTRWGEVRLKLAYLGDELMNRAPEFEDCRRLAREHNVPLKSVMEEAMKAFQRGGSTAAEWRV